MSEQVRLRKARALGGDIITVDVLTGYLEQMPPLERVDLSRCTSAHWSEVHFRSDVGRHRVAQCLRDLADVVDAGPINKPTPDGEEPGL